MNNKQLFRKEKDDTSNYNIWQACNEYTLAQMKLFLTMRTVLKGLGRYCMTAIISSL